MRANRELARRVAALEALPGALAPLVIWLRSFSGRIDAPTQITMQGTALEWLRHPGESVEAFRARVETAAANRGGSIVVLNEHNEPDPAWPAPWPKAGQQSINGGP